MKSRSWRSWIFGGLGLLLFCVCMSLLIWVIHQFGWNWTGFSTKTLWDSALPTASPLWLPHGRSGSLTPSGANHGP